MFSFLTGGVLMHEVKFGNRYWYVLKKIQKKFYYVVEVDMKENLTLVIIQLPKIFSEKSEDI